MCVSKQLCDQLELNAASDAVNCRKLSALSKNKKMTCAKQKPSTVTSEWLAKQSPHIATITLIFSKTCHYRVYLLA